MSKFKALYKMMNDDLKDAEMIIDYAYELKEDDKQLADILATDAKNRLAHFNELHKIFVDETKEIKMDKEKVYDCLWDTTHEYMMERYECVEKCIEKY